MCLTSNSHVSQYLGCPGLHATDFSLLRATSHPSNDSLSQYTFHAQIGGQELVDESALPSRLTALKTWGLKITMTENFYWLEKSTCCKPQSFILSG